MSEVRLPALAGDNPLGLFAALGVLDGLDRQLPHARAQLHWTEGVVPQAVITGLDSIDQVVEALDEDRRRWERSPVLTWGPGGKPLDDLKPSLSELRRWIAFVLEGARLANRFDIDLLSALVSEGAALRQQDKAQPTHFDFTTGQQRFLRTVRDIREAIDDADLRAALIGPWAARSDLKNLRWDPRVERAALGALVSPGNGPGTSPGADWLGFLGLTFFPVSTRQGRVSTTGCTYANKRWNFRWPLWAVPSRPASVRSLLGDSSLSSGEDPVLRLRGVSRVLEAPIWRIDKGQRANTGYGCFGAPVDVSSGSSGYGDDSTNFLIRDAGA